MNQTHRFENHQFIIDDYDKQKPFASFLPGMAGARGIPLWSFYVNRGQGISSFGLRDKNGAILEFYPANLAYLYVSKIGFRTFLKVNGQFKECFLPEDNVSKKTMMISQSEFTLLEIDPKLNLETKVTYFGLPNESFAALVRKVDITNRSKKAQTLELLDGISQLLPSGIDYGGYKAISNLLRSWMNVDNLEENVAFYKLRSSTGDEAEMKTSKDGNFYLSVVNGKLVKPIADMDLVYGYDTAMNRPAFFESHSLASIESMPQVTENKVPCGFTPMTLTLKPGETVEIRTLIGYTHEISAINSRRHEFEKPGYFDQKQTEAKQEIDALLKDVALETAQPIYDEYIRQNYLDNLLRGGYPMTIKTAKQDFVYYLYSRKHGDLERDYNFFSIAPEYYSQGNGNFRDVCQNRRNDVLIHPESGDYSIFVFASLIQADGYNPLSINGSTFEIEDKSVVESIVKDVFTNDDGTMATLLKSKFTPGSIVNTMAQKGIHTLLNDIQLFEKIFVHASQSIEASFGEGYWVDHWTYILDLVENYLAIFPDHQDDLLFNRSNYRYFDSPVSVYPRSEKTVLDHSGVVHQYGSLRHPDHEKIKRCHLNENGTNWLKDNNQRYLETNLASKLFVLALTKYANLDPEGLGIEMEANKPGWNDAMNGLPGIFASGVSETIELTRLVRFLRHIPSSGSLNLPNEFIRLMNDIDAITETDPFAYWDRLSTAKETYREAIRFGSRGTKTINVDTVIPLLDKLLIKLESAMDAIYELGDGIVPTYLYYEATDFTAIKDTNNQPVIGHYGLPLVTVKAFKRHQLPAFLEGPARYLKTNHDRDKNRQMMDKLKQSGVYDAQLKMYKTSDDLDAYGFEIGRIRAFTKGWLEREANFLHMTYKYLLGILKSSEYDRFYEEAKDNLVCYMDPAKYGRSTLENSSFIATSNNPNPNLYGQGFVARLSGSTAEMLSIYYIQFFGKQPFTMENGQLVFQLKPILTPDFFKNGQLKASFIGQTVCYHNATQKPTYGLKPTRYVLTDSNGNKFSVDSDRIVGEYAHKVRQGEWAEIDVTFTE